MNLRDYVMDYIREDFGGFDQEQQQTVDYARVAYEGWSIEHERPLRNCYNQLMEEKAVANMPPKQRAVFVAKIFATYAPELSRKDDAQHDDQ